MISKFYKNCNYQVTLPKTCTSVLMSMFIWVGMTAQTPRPIPIEYPSGVNKNFIRTWDATAPETSVDLFLTRPIKDVKQTTQYFDGLGRELQTVVKKGSLETNPSDPASSANAVDLVNATEYDQYGREVYKYLPFAANNTGGNPSISDGLFKLNPFHQQATFMGAQFGGQGETWFYGQTIFETSPLHRMIENYAAGNSWSATQGQALETNRRAVKMKYWINKATDDVKKWTVSEPGIGNWGTYTMAGTYVGGELHKIVTVDENNKQIIEFKDKEGRTILKKVQLTSTPDDGTGKNYTGWLSTYYVYDEFKQLRLVIQPKGVELLISNSWNITALSGVILSDHCFRYEYDQRGRMIMKKIPGGVDIYMIYDKWDRLVLTQDGNLRQQNKWLFSKFDLHNRPIFTGIYTDVTNTTFSAMLTYMNTQNLARFENYLPSGALPMYTTNLSFPAITYADVLTVTYYDDYAWTNGVPVAFRTFDATFNSSFYAPSNSTWPYPQPIQASNVTEGLVTGTISKALDGSTAMVTTHFYDEMKRVIQTKSENYLGGCDIHTTQYSFSGQILKKMIRHQRPGSPAITSSVFSIHSYDELMRLIEIKKNVSATIGAENPTTGDVVILQNEYDKLGHLKTKKLGRTKDLNGNYTSTPLETQALDYNIRGWMMGVNRSSVLAANGNSPQYFGFELGFDKLTNASGKNFTAAQYSGDISGMIWKTNGDGIRRKYDFTYDGANRLMQALFEQNDESTTWGKTTANFDMKMGDGLDVSLAYDANGNIQRMQHWGIKVNGIAHIDDLAYSYITNTNKLQAVADNSTGGTPVTGSPGLGDFINKNNTASDYGYDPNGNLITDLNKRLNGTTGNNLTSGGAITYNHLNLPTAITVKKDDGSARGTISYVFDATGNKIKKTVTETGQTTKTSLYLSGFVYENDVLQFFGHEEGRVRFAPAVGATPSKFHFDYFLKDHLGNVRMVLTDEQQQDVYPAATLEGDLNTTTDAAYIEKNYYHLETSKIVIASEATGITAYPNNNGNPPYNINPNSNTTANSQKLYKLTATTGGGVTGLSFAIKVMGGDKIDIWGKSYYFTNNTNTTNYNVPILSVLDGFMGSPGSPGIGKTTSSELNGISVITGAINTFLTNADRNSGGTTQTPKAFVNYILLDENFRYVTGNFSKVGSASVVKNHHDDLSMQNINVERNGYLYVYVSNESPVSVYFDNLQVIHTRGPILEETHYYPFGLAMAGISSKAAGKQQNKYKFNGIEQTNDLDINQYDAFYRNLDPQIGRWWQIDPKPSDMQSVYSAMDNNPIKLTDFMGDTTYLYTMSGVYKGFIPDKLKTNEVVFLGNDKLYRVLNTMKGRSWGITANDLAKKVRSADFADARITGKTVEQMTKQWVDNSSSEKTGFLYVDPKTKEVQISVCSNCGNNSNEASMDKLKPTYDEVAKKGSIIGVWHSHPEKSSYVGSQPTATRNDDFTSPPDATRTATTIGMIVSQKTVTIYPCSNPVTRFTENKIDKVVTTPRFSKNFIGTSGSAQYGVFNSSLTPKTFWKE